MACNYCGKPIKWIQTEAGKKMPCDIKLIPYWAAEHGPSKIVTPDGKVVSCFLEGETSKTTGLGYVPHWATCPEAKKAKSDAKQKAKNETPSLF